MQSFQKEVQKSVSFPCSAYLHKDISLVIIGYIHSPEVETPHIIVLTSLSPHNGPDDLSNMLCLCPNHHSQFDVFSFYIDSDNLQVKGLKEFQDRKINVSSKHKINKEFLEYHKKLFDKKN